LTVSHLLRRYTPEFVRQHPGQAVPQVQSTLAKLGLCRTAALGGHSHVGQAVPDDLGGGLEQVPKVPAFDETFM